MDEHSNKPSKQFIKRGIIAISALAIILVVQTKWFGNLFRKNKNTSPIVASTTVGDLVGKDTNGNGIPDWEESLWGLDPTVLYTNGISNESIINAKKSSLGVTSADSADLDDTDRLARELFTLTQALGQSDEIDSATLQAISAKLASSVNIKSINSIYSLKDIHTQQTTQANLVAYNKNFNTVLSHYDTNTPDIEVLITALQNEDTSGLSVLEQSGATYQKLARELTTIPVPLGLAQEHLVIVNSFSGVATAFNYMTELGDNSIVALVGVSIYKNYSSKLDAAIRIRNDYLRQYGIL